MEEEQHIAKGRRTKRLRLLSPCGATVMTSSCSSGDNNNANSFSSNESTDQEEEDMANCLILLAQGRAISHHHQQDQGNNKISNRKFAEIATPSATPNSTINTKVGFYIYECKTCNRTFPSFQALGGHRASHKKPKLITVEEKKPPPPPSPPPSQPKIIANYDEIGEAEQIHMKIGPPISLQLGNQSHRAFHGNNKAKIHECSICGSEFTSGQALGGHMRRHRAASTNITTTETSSNIATVAIAANREVQHRNILELDLNLPAPEDDLRESKFQFPATQKSMVLSAAPALVDCHY